MGNKLDELKCINTVISILQTQDHFSKSMR